MKIEFVIPTHSRADNLILILQSLVVQTNNNWKAGVIIDGYNSRYEKIKKFYEINHNIVFIHIDGPNNDSGHTPGNYGLSHATEEWVILTGDDNYYVPSFVDIQ
jgi:glycosyltransferase involved in cell wall biosynthesis